MASTYPTVTASLVTLITAAMVAEGETGVAVLPAWDPNNTAESVFIGRAIWDPTQADLTEITYEYPTAELNVPRFEVYPVIISTWAFRPELAPEKAQTAIDRIFALKAIVDSVFADVDLGAGVTVSHRPTSSPVEKRAYQRGWACGVTSEIEVRALLTT